MNRTDARASAMKLIYEWDMGGNGGEDTHIGILELTPDEPEYAYMVELVDGVKANVKDIDERIERHAEGWKLDRLMRVDMAIMRVCMYELIKREPPAGVAISAAVALAEKYSTDKASSFVNGVLGNAWREMEAT